MTQTKHLMAGIVTHGHDIAALIDRVDWHVKRREVEGVVKAKGAIQTLRAERDIKRDLLARMCAPWFEGEKS